MSETTWLPLPTHSGWWWIRYFSYTDAINVTMEDDGPHRDDDNALLCESDEIRYFPIPDPPADSVKLPRRFLWKPDKYWGDKARQLFGIELLDGTGMVDGIWGISQQWLSDHSAEIEWIDP